MSYLRVKIQVSTTAMIRTVTAKKTNSSFVTAEKHFSSFSKNIHNCQCVKGLGESDGEGWGIRVVVRREGKTMGG